MAFGWSADGGGGRFCGLEFSPALAEGGGILPDAGRRGRAPEGLCFGGSSRSSTKGSLLFACNFWVKKPCTSPICDNTVSDEMRGYGGGGEKSVTV